jgi:hypothetical protein
MEETLQAGTPDTPQPEHSAMSAKRFLSALYGDTSGGYITVWHKRTKATKWFAVKDLSAAAEYAVNKARDETAKDEIYFGVCLRKARLSETERGKSSDISVMPGLWYDIDIAEAESNVHAKKDLPNCIEAATVFLTEVAPKPTILVNSGHGLHAYWLFDKPLEITGDKAREQCVAVSNGWQNHLNAEAAKRGWNLDTTSDLPRILRLPETINRKNGGDLEVRVIEYSGTRYLPKEFSKYAGFRALNAPQGGSSAKPGKYPSAQTAQAAGEVWGDCKAGNADKMLSGCAFMRYCQENAQSLSEPEWWAAITNLALASDGEKLCHEISKPYPNYERRETAAKIKNARQENKPVTCEYIKHTLRFSGCGNCPCKCKAPIALTVVGKDDDIKERLAALPETAERAFDDEYIASLGYAKQHIPGLYAQVKIRLKEKLKVNLNDLEKAVKATECKQADRSQSAEAQPLTLDDIEHGYVIPKGYLITAERGIERVKPDGGIVQVSFNPILIAERIFDVDTRQEKVKLKFLRSGKWTEFVTERNNAFQNNCIVRFANTGLSVSSNNAAGIVGYLTDFENANDGNIPTKRAVSKIGWHGDDFLPFTGDGDIAYEPDGEFVSIAESLREKGSFAEWRKAAELVRTSSPTARLLFCASFAAPLLCRIDLRTFMLFTWCRSTFGKSASIKAGISAWGNPQVHKLQGTFNTTLVGVERKCAALNHLPFGIDERQLLNTKRIDPQTLCYTFAEESSKLKGEKSGNAIAETLTWKTIILASGEQPIIEHNAQDGVHTRVLTLTEKPLKSKEDAELVHLTVNANYGHAGRMYITKLVERIKGGYDLQADFDRMCGEVKSRADGENVHLKNVAAVALGDYLSAMFVFGEESQTAWSGALDTAVNVIGGSDKQKHETTGERGCGAILDWLMTNKAKFVDGEVGFGERYGVVQEKPEAKQLIFYVYPTVFEKAIADAGFSAEQVIRSLKEAGLMLTRQVPKPYKGKTVYYDEDKLHKRMHGGNPRVYTIVVPCDGRDETEEALKLRNTVRSLVPLSPEEAGELPF